MQTLQFTQESLSIPDVSTLGHGIKLLIGHTILYYSKL